MELYDESINIRNQKNSKIPMIIGICIGILILFVVLIIYCIVYLRNSMTTVKIDGEVKNEIEKIFYVETTEQGSQLYIPIIKISEYLGYQGFKGDYKNKSEDQNKCYVISENETAMFTLNSNTLVKTTKDTEYEYIKLEKETFEKDGELYTTIEGIQKAFNVVISCDEKFKNIQIYSMDFLIKYHANRLSIKEYSESFSDKKAIINNMIIIKNEEKYGVVDIQEKGENLLECKYDLISYIPSTTDFLVESNGKYGIITKESETKIKILYDQIKIIDYQNGLYLVKQNDTYGILNTDGKVIIEPEYKKIGIDKDKYTGNGVENQYILLDEIIPVQNSEEVWALFNIKGTKISEFKYTEIGCESTPVANAYPAVTIPSHKIIVVKKDKNYNLITTKGDELISGYLLDSVYLKINTATEENQFFMTLNNNTKVINIEEWLTSIGR